MNKKSILYKTLARALSMGRPHNSQATAYFTHWLWLNLPQEHSDVAWLDVAGNLHVDLRTAATNKTLFVAHVDTVHREAKPNKIFKDGYIWRAVGAPLGADDGAGCAMLMHLIHKGVPAYYVFTQGEECGGIGATHLVKEHPSLLAEFDRAIAFDRRGIDSVITHQGFGRCCSDAFADVLARELSATNTLMYSPDSTGVYTDTAEFINHIPECTNISVGYYNEHSDREYLDTSHLVALAKRCARINWDSLPCEREPGVVDKDDFDALYAQPSLRISDNDDSLYDLRQEVFEAIECAIEGSKSWLKELVANSAYPADPDMAMRYININRMDDAMLKQYMNRVDVADPDDLLCEIFDECYMDSIH